MTVAFVSPIPDILVGELLSLYRLEWWTATRTEADVRTMLAGPAITFAALDQDSGEVIGFARVVSDNVYLAVVLDVIVRADRRGSGLGRSLLQFILHDPRLIAVHSIELVCQPELVGFYEHLAFTDKVGRSRLMRRTTDSVLTG